MKGIERCAEELSFEEVLVPISEHSVGRGRWSQAILTDGQALFSAQAMHSHYSYDIHLISLDLT